MKDFSAEFDISVLTGGQQEWLLERAHNHHFETAMLDKIDTTGAWITVCYDDGLHIHFFVEPVSPEEYRKRREDVSSYLGHHWLSGGG
jgi:hypothetical protein